MPLKQMLVHVRELLFDSGEVVWLQLETLGSGGVICICSKRGISRKHEKPRKVFMLLLLLLFYLHEKYLLFFFLWCVAVPFVDHICTPGLSACFHWLVMFTN